ncbi:MAG: HAD-IIA family hydrolase [Candidatus Heimdallarchaeota archaeon]
MPKLIDELKNLKLAIFDLDGVIYRGDNLIPGTENIISDLKKNSIKVVYNSNNSTVTRQVYVERLRKMNIPSKVEDFYTSASITSKEITKIKEYANIFVIGEIGLREELKSLGHTIETNPKDYNKVDFVVVGLDRNFTYDTLAIAQRCILEGNAQFYATNTDSTLPVARGLKPGAGTMVNALITCTGKQPIRIFGKPEPFGINLILKDFQIPSSQACIFGDRLNTDILAGNRAGITTIAVLTGVTTKEMIQDLRKKAEDENNFDDEILPDIIIDRLSDIFKD